MVCLRLIAHRSPEKPSWKLGLCHDLPRSREAGQNFYGETVEEWAVIGLNCIFILFVLMMQSGPRRQNDQRLMGDGSSSSQGATRGRR